MYWHDMGWSAWIPMTLGILIVCGLIAWLVVRLGPASSAGGGDAEPSAREVLDLRFARGEIGVGDYETARRLLERDTMVAEAQAPARETDDAERVTRT